MTDQEEKTYQLCTGIAGLFYRRSRLILTGRGESAEMLDLPLKQLIEDLKFWLLKNE